MNTRVNKLCGNVRTLSLAAAGALALCAALGMPLQAQAQTFFAGPEQAADALIDALATNDDVALARVLGKGWRPLTGMLTVDIDDQMAFLRLASQSRTVNTEGGRAHLVVGTDPWVLPIPIVRGKEGQWRFDPVGAQDEIAVRRIGANERAAIQAVLAYADAQRDYFLADRNGDGVLSYAQKLVSSPGKRDGLIWSANLGDDSPLGEGFLPKRAGEGYHGYRFKILTAQGGAAPGGARSYVLGKQMVGGFALVAWPVQYGKTGVMSFMVNQDGRVFERNLGPQSARLANAITAFNPDGSWKLSKP